LEFGKSCSSDAPAFFVAFLSSSQQPAKAFGRVASSKYSRMHSLAISRIFSLAISRMFSSMFGVIIVAPRQ